ncbi:hypothetical protein LTR08_005474 [Meristemomyces frigidus]|nr:hypothetical protein LTR08_005474 [Meristemomyces frigidus]
MMPPFAQPRLVTPLERQASHPKTPSPNYFGFQTNDTGDTQNHWSPPSSTVRSTAAASPSVVPVDQNPDFDAFRRQSDGSKAFNLGGLGGTFKMNAPPVAVSRAKLVRTASKTASGQSATSTKTFSEARDMPLGGTRAGSLASLGSLDPATAELSRSPKRLLSPGSVAQVEPIRKGSPATFIDNGEPERAQSTQVRSPSVPRFPLPLDDMSAPHGLLRVHKAETFPATTSGAQPGEQLLVTPQHVVNLMESKPEEILLLDIRVLTMYATAHISGALNLCIPTTLLKRPSFNVRKLADSFKDDDERTKFESWRNSSYIIVYDNASAQLKDAAICVNTIKKFQGEGYKGKLHIVCGGFLEFKTRFPKHTDAAASASEHAGEQILGSGPGFLEGPRIAGGCPMPGTDRPANPFFGNIRQNMDLIGGVGQIALKHPEAKDAGRRGQNSLNGAEEAVMFPSWLRKAAEDGDQGKAVAGKFEAIERREKKRMEDALSGQVSYGAQATSAAKKNQTSARESDIQIAGIEKGNKNRYNNIWPFEHTRVKLQHVPRETGCDYFNANFIQAAWSHKRYISTQAPIPATFADFWSVVWEQDVRVIVMLTAEREGAQVKAHCYWEEKQYGALRLEFLSEKRASLEPARIHKHRQQQQRPGSGRRTETRSMHPQIPLATLDSDEVNAPSTGDDGNGAEGGGAEQPFCIVRKFMLRNERQPFAPMREVTQLQFASWPDFGAPAHPKHLLGLVEQTDAVVRASSTRGAGGYGGTGAGKGTEPEVEGERPVLVHCSAGCGRTGTFCTVDSVIDMMKRQRLDRREARGEGKGEGRGGMDVDVKESTPKRASSRHNKTDSMLSDAPDKSGGSSDFFASKDVSGDLDMDRETTTDANTKADSAVDMRQESLDGKWVHGQDVDLVEKTVEDFRNQRLSMVQSLRQYVLCYESVMEWLAEQSPVVGTGEVM